MLEIRGGCLDVSEDVSVADVRVEHAPCSQRDLGKIGSGEPGQWEGKECVCASPQWAGQMTLHVYQLRRCCRRDWPPPHRGGTASCCSMVWRSCDSQAKKHIVQ